MSVLCHKRTFGLPVLASEKGPPGRCQVHRTWGPNVIAPRAATVEDATGQALAHLEFGAPLHPGVRVFCSFTYRLNPEGTPPRQTPNDAASKD